jgi:hypothetical protein
MPQMRESLWSLVAKRLDSLETGLSLVLEGLDCGGGQLGAIEGLARDANGAPVLLMLAIDGDALLTARVLAAISFVERVGDSLCLAVPEGGFASGVHGRVVVVGTETAAASFEQLRRVPFAALQLCRLEPFRIAGSERFAVRWLPTTAAADAAADDPAIEFAVAPSHREHWLAIERLCQRLDPAVRLSGDRFWRRITYQGTLLGQVLVADGVLHTSGPDGVRRSVLSAADVREFGDQLVRRFAVLRGLVGDPGAPPVGGELRTPGAGVGGRAMPRQPAAESLRSTLVHARLSPEEYSALGGPMRTAEVDTEAVADDVARIVAAQEGSWAGPSLRSD